MSKYLCQCNNGIVYGRKRYHQKQDSSSKIPIEINCKPLSPKNNNTDTSKSKNEDDLAPKYFNTSSIKNVQIPKEYLNAIIYSKSNILIRKNLSLNIII